jgi:hypothetical protein
MVEMDHKIAVVRNDSIVESQFSNVTPILEGAPLKGCRAPS